MRKSEVGHARLDYARLGRGERGWKCSFELDRMWCTRVNEVGFARLDLIGRGCVKANEVGFAHLDFIGCSYAGANEVGYARLSLLGLDLRD